MPAITSGRVLVTGANGYIAVWIVKSLLDAGFAVRGTVRAESKATYLRKLFQSFGDKFDVVVVPDMTKEDAFAEHVKDVDAIAHTASPFHMNAVDPDEIIGPAVAGTLSVLKAAHVHGAAVQRVVVLSSTAALFRTTTEPVVLDESAWNEQAIAEVKEKGRDAPAVAKYRASKTLAERAAWDWYEEKKKTGAVGWDLVTLNPPFVYGPILHECARPEELNQSMRDWYHMIVEGKIDNETLVNGGAMYVDVRDIAQAHTLALLKPDAGDNRFIISAGPYKWQEFATAAHKFSEKLPAGVSSFDPSKATHLLQYDNSKGIKILGLKYRSIDEVTKDSLEDFKTRGWI
ncbi:NAD(P)-binding protein [Lentinus tigrinus ALCF2SS1-7]|uniref:NAD(P)-binding protein n=1 Tax=Lentinus tigrinus ALCF2SS1-6 TaxID=1328759 RepID=A0A5C2SPL9_9APHY|nr:NAD(P)-binding protein [Lentinus tigrinus ALCF2SS1-6]RPD79303.1 NAD(P)-binding protein [Lentinus tigrinus ALCF2SS1-7]